MVADLVFCAGTSHIDMGCQNRVMRFWPDFDPPTDDGWWAYDVSVMVVATCRRP
jgi:hypothetical protein